MPALTTLETQRKAFLEQRIEALRQSILLGDTLAETNHSSGNISRGLQSTVVLEKQLAECEYEWQLLDFKEKGIKYNPSKGSVRFPWENV